MKTYYTFRLVPVTLPFSVCVCDRIFTSLGCVFQAFCSLKMKRCDSIRTPWIFLFLFQQWGSYDADGRWVKHFLLDFGKELFLIQSVWQHSHSVLFWKKSDWTVRFILIDQYRYKLCKFDLSLLLLHQQQTLAESMDFRDVFGLDM